MRSFGCAPFYIFGGCGMRDQKNVIDVTGVELIPGDPVACSGNGEQGFECCCDECDFFLLCFPEFDPRNIRNV